MATQLVLYIQSDINDTDTYEKVDLYKDEKVSLTMTLQDIRDIEKVRTDFSQPFTLPASSLNNKLFKHWHNPDIVGYNSNYRHPAKIEINYLPFRVGFISLNSVKLKDGDPEFYNVTFYGETVDLKNIINEDLISQLSWLDSPGFQFLNDNNSARQGLNNGLNKTVDSVTYNKAFVYPLISHSVVFNYDSSWTSGTGNTNWTNLYSASGKTKSGVFYNDLKPAIRVDLILKAIQFQYGITFSSDFFFTSATENLYLWMSRNKGPVEGGGSISLENQASTCNGQSGNIDCDFFNGQFLCCDPGNCGQESTSCIPFEVTVNDFQVNIMFGTNSCVAQNLMRQVKIEYEVIVDPADANKPYDFYVKNNDTGSNEFVRLNQVGSIGTNPATNPPITVIKATDTGMPYNPTNNDLVGQTYTAQFYPFIECSETLNFDIKMTVSAYVPYKAYYFVPDPQGGGGDCEGQTDYPIMPGFVAEYTATAGQLQTEVQIIPTEQLPEIKILDFLTGLFKTFNLTAYFENGVTVVKTLDDFYSTFETWDLTKNVHSNETTISEALPFSEIVFAFPEPKTILAQKFEQINNRRYGELRYLADASRSAKYGVLSPFEHMLFERMSDSSGSGIGLTNFQQGTFLDDNLNPSFGKPLLFYAEQNTESSVVINWIDGFRPQDVTQEPASGVRQPFANYIMPMNSNEIGTSSVAPSISLNFGSEINTYNLTDYGGNNNSLFQNYYQDYITRVFDQRNRLFAFKVKLPIKFLLKFKLSDKILIGNREYLINKVTADLTTGDSTMELLNIF